MTKTTCAIYARLSQQGETEESITRQIELGAAYAHARQWETRLYIEPKGYRSGYYEHQRPAWQQLKKDLASRDDIIAVVVADFARASRNVEHFFAFVEFLQTRNIQFVSLKEQVDASTAAGRALLGMIAVFNQFYRDDVSERKKRQFKHRDPAIYAPNHAPLGLKRTGAYPNIKWESTPDLKFVIEMLTLYAAGLSAARVATDMQSKGHTWRAMRNSIAPTEITVRNVINKVERYADFIDPTLLYRVQTARARRAGRKANSKNIKHPLPFLRQLIYCADCGARFYTRWRCTRAGSDGSYYEHPPSQCPHARRQTIAKLLHDQFWARFRWLDELTDADLDYIAQRIAEQGKETPPTEDSALRRAKLVTRLQGYEQMRADGDISRDRFNHVREEIEHVIAALDKTLQRTRVQVRVERIAPAGIRRYLIDLRGALRAQSIVDWQATNILFQTILARVRVRHKELIAIEFREGWEGLFAERLEA